MPGRLPKVVAGLAVILLIALVVFLVTRPVPRGQAAPWEEPKNPGPPKVTPAPPKGKEPERPVVVVKPQPREVKHQGGELLVQMVGRRVAVEGEPQANVRCQPASVMPMVFAVIFGPSQEADGFRVPGNVDVSKAITVRVLKQAEDKSWVLMEAAETRAVRQRREGAGEFLAGGDTVYTLYELTVRTDGPMTIRVEATLECAKVAAGWNARVTAQGEPVVIREGAEWEVYEALKGKAEALQMAGDEEGAEEMFEEMMRRWPGLPMPMMELAGRMLQRGRMAEAEELAQRALKAFEAMALPEEDPVLGRQWADVTDPRERRRAAEEFKIRQLQGVRQMLEEIRSKK